MADNLTSTLRKAATKSGSMLSLSKRANVPYAVVHGFVRDGKGIMLETADKLADVLGLQLTPVKPRGGRKDR